MDELPQPPPTLYYGEFDAQGSPQGFWTSDVFPPQEDGSLHRKIPKEAIEITELQWRQLLNNQPLSRFIDGKVVILDPPPPSPQPPDPLEEIKTILVDMDARLTELEKPK